LAKELFPDNFKPTPAHLFCRLLNEKGLLLRNFTQNIDTLELAAGIPVEKLVFAHGSFGSSHCIECKKEYATELVKEHIFADKIPRCHCSGLIKPDIVFFGENLPARFFQLIKEDFPQCDLLIVMGTSLTVHPFASLINQVPETCPRLLLNLKTVGETNFYSSHGFDFNEATNYRDVRELDYCDSAVKKFASYCGWEQDFDKILSEFGHTTSHSAVPKL